jgi:peptide chain release factor 2
MSDPDRRLAAVKKATRREGMAGRQIRSYVLEPTSRVVDHRTNLESVEADDVLNGDLDSFLRAALAHGARGTA